MYFCMVLSTFLTSGNVENNFTKMISFINSTLLAIPIISIRKTEAIFYNKDTAIKCNTRNNCIQYSIC